MGGRGRSTGPGFLLVYPRAPLKIPHSPPLPLPPLGRALTVMGNAGALSFGVCTVRVCTKGAGPGPRATWTRLDSALGVSGVLGF